MPLQAWTTSWPPHWPRSVRGRNGPRLTFDLWHHRVLTRAERGVGADNLDARLDRLLDGGDESDAVERQHDEALELFLSDRVLHRVVLLGRVEARVDLRQLDIRVFLQHAGDSIEFSLNVRVGERCEVGDVDRRLPGRRCRQRQRRRSDRGRAGHAECNGDPPSAPLGHVVPFLRGLTRAGLRGGGRTTRAYPRQMRPCHAPGLGARKPPVVRREGGERPT